MGIRFGLNSTNIVGYLIAPTTTRLPRISREGMNDFLYSLMQESNSGTRRRFISSDPEWTAHIEQIAEAALKDLTRLSPPWEGYLADDIITRVLGVLRQILGSYDVYVLPIGTWDQSDALDRFADEVAFLPGGGILVLIPDYFQPAQNVDVLNPSEASQIVIENRNRWPGAVMMLRTGETAFFPLDEARLRLGKLSESLHEGNGLTERARDILMEPVPDPLITEPPRRILHLSDLHFGTRRAQHVEMYVATQLSRVVRSASQVVITGDLFDQPRSRHAQDFRNFATQIQLQSEGRAPIIVPGNHDQRIFGNSIWRLGRRLNELAELRWQPVIIDAAAKLVFLCFDSSRTGYLARGSVDTEQLLQVATEFDVKNTRGDFDGFLKVAVLHHHPYPYSETELPIIDPRGWVGRESFLELVDSERFLEWCAMRGVGLVLHGHKHVPRLVVDSVGVGQGDTRTWHSMTTVGCGSTLGAGGSYLSYNVLEWQSESATWNVRFMIDRGDGSGFFPAALQSQVLG